MADSIFVIAFTPIRVHFHDEAGCQESTAGAKKLGAHFESCRKSGYRPLVMASIDDLYRAGIRLHQQGKAVEAARAYDEILKQKPDHAGALQLRGVLALQSGNYEAAIGLIERSL